jgi:translocation protein SEC62
MMAIDKDARFPDDMKKRYPKHLLPLRQNTMKDKGFYMWTVERSKGKLAFFLFLIVMVVIFFMLFNIWPLWLKIALWYISFYLLILLVIKEN